MSGILQQVGVLDYTVAVCLLIFDFRVTHLAMSSQPVAIWESVEVLNLGRLCSGLVLVYQLVLA